MKQGVKTILIILGILLVFAALVWTKIYLSSEEYLKRSGKNPAHIADIATVQNSIKNDSLYEVKDVVYRDSAILVAVSNPEKSGTDEYFNKKYLLNGYDNISMVYIYKYDTAKPLQSVSFDDALMATGKKLGKFQQDWVAKYIDTLDHSCKPLKKYLQLKLNRPESFKNEETVFQPENIHSMQVICKYRAKDSLGGAILSQVTAVVDSAGNVVLTK